MGGEAKLKIAFTKAHGAQNDFLLSWAADVPSDRLPEAAVAICHRHTGVGADGWILVSRDPTLKDCDAAIRLFNPDGSEPELSGNGTRCAAAFLLEHGLAGHRLRLLTGAGIKELHLVERQERRYRFEMNMGTPSLATPHHQLSTSAGLLDVAILNVGNPQCAVFLPQLPANWRQLGAEIERHPDFPHRTNVSFVRVVDKHTLDVRFWERGAGATFSSGTGSTAAAAAAILRGLVESPVEVLTPAGPLLFRWDPGGDMFLTGPAEVVAQGEFYFT